MKLYRWNGSEVVSTEASETKKTYKLQEYRAAFHSRRVVPKSELIRLGIADSPQGALDLARAKEITAIANARVALNRAKKRLKRINQYDR